MLLLMGRVGGRTPVLVGVLALRRVLLVLLLGRALVVLLLRLVLLLGRRAVVGGLLGVRGVTGGVGGLLLVLLVGGLLRCVLALCECC